MLCLLVLLILPCLCLGSGDSTLRNGTRGSSVVEAAIQRVDHSCIFADDKLFFRRLAFVESLDGRIPSTYRDGYHGGIWQVDKNAFDVTKRYDSYLRTKKQEIRTYFNIDWDSSHWEDLRKPLYSLLAARLYFGYETKSRNNGIPRAIKDQANLWKVKYRNAKDVNVFVQRAEKLETGCKTSPGVDLSFVLDGSGSIGSTNFQQIKRFVRSVVQAFNDTIDKGTSQVSVIQYSSRSKVEFYFNRYRSVQQILRAVDNIRYMGGGTATNLALDQMTRYVFNTANGARPANSEHPRVGIVLTDGISNNIRLTKEAAKRAHDKDIILFSVGVGTNLNKKELEYIASDPVCLHLFELKDGFKEIESLKSAIIKRTCNVPIPPFVPANDSKEIEVRPDVDIKCKVLIPKEGSTVKIEARTGSITYFVAEKAYPNEAFYDHKIEATPGRRGVIFIPRTNTINSDFTVFCSIKANNQTANVSIAIRKNNTDWCRTRPCKNGGQCIDLGRIGYRCACLPGYTGRHCETVIDNCSPNPCKAGTCRNQVNQFTCICPPGKKGKLCDEDTRPGYDCRTSNPCTEENRAKNKYYFPHPDRRNFVQCDAFGQCHVLRCPSGLEWDDDINTCNRPKRP